MAAALLQDPLQHSAESEVCTDSELAVDSGTGAAEIGIAAAWAVGGKLVHAVENAQDTAVCLVGCLREDL